MRDVIVIGGGGGGPVVAKELAARGLDVLVLEAGPHFADPERDWSHFSQDAGNAVTGYFRWGPADRAEPPWARELHPASLVVQQVAGVGGTTQHYSANCPRAMAGVFRGYDGRDRAAYDTRHRFPFTYRELIPYYEWVEATLPVQTAAMGTKEEVFFRGAERAGLAVNRHKDITRASFRPQENCILQPAGTAGRSDSRRDARFPRARGCTFCGHCAEGCFEPIGAPLNLKAKRSTLVSYIPMALTADRWQRGGRAANLVANAFVERIEFSTNGASATATGVSYRVGSHGELETEQARVVVLAAGAIESPRLWLNSGLPNPNGWVGRGMTNHFSDAVTALMPFETGFSKGPQSAARADFPGRGCLQAIGTPPAEAAASLALGIHTGRASGTVTASHTSGRLVGRELVEYLAHIDRLMAVVVGTDDDVDARNGVSLSSSLPPDVHGAVPRIDIAVRTRRSLRNRRFLIRAATMILERAGAVAIHHTNPAPIMQHIHSTLRMGESARDSVLDASGEARFVARLFVADNSAPSNALGGPNPTLTTQAIATRTALPELLTRLNDAAKSKVLTLQEYFVLAGKSLRFIFARPFYGQDVVQQMDEIGVKSLGIVLLTGLFTGMVLALQSSVQLKTFGATMYIGNLVSASMIRELGPGARRADGRRPRGIGHRRAARLDARDGADRRAQHARHRSDQEARHAAGARRADHAAGADGHQRLRRDHRRQHHRRRSSSACRPRSTGDGLGSDRRRRLHAALHPERFRPGAVEAVRVRRHHLDHGVLLRPRDDRRHRRRGAEHDAHGRDVEHPDSHRRLLHHADPALGAVVWLTRRAHGGRTSRSSDGARSTTAEERESARSERDPQRAARDERGARGANAIPTPRVVELDHVSLAFDVPILEDVSFAAREGETIAIVGESGTGKSTMLKLILRLLVPDRGRVLIDGEDITDLTFEEALRSGRRWEWCFRAPRCSTR